MKHSRIQDWIFMYFHRIISMVFYNMRKLWCRTTDFSGNQNLISKIKNAYLFSQKFLKSRQVLQVLNNHIKLPFLQPLPTLISTENRSNHQQVFSKHLSLKYRRNPRKSVKTKESCLKTVKRVHGSINLQTKSLRFY